MTSTNTKTQITHAIERLQEEVPALGRLKLVARLELRARGGDTPIWRVEVPGPKISKDPVADARLDISMNRSQFNELVDEGQLGRWIEAYQRGYVHVSGDAAVMKLLGNVIERQRSRSRA